MDINEVVNQRQAAAYLGVTQKTLRRWQLLKIGPKSFSPPFLDDDRALFAFPELEKCRIKYLTHPPEWHIAFVARYLELDEPILTYLRATGQGPKYSIPDGVNVVYDPTSVQNFKKELREQLFKASNCFTPEQVSKRLGVDKRQLKKWRRAGDGPTFFKSATRIFYTPAGLENWVRINAEISEGLYVDMPQACEILGVNRYQLKLIMGHYTCPKYIRRGTRAFFSKKTLLDFKENDPAFEKMVKNNISNAEAAKILGMSIDQMKRLRLSSAGPKYTKSFGRVMYNQSDLDEYLESIK